MDGADSFMNWGFNPQFMGDTVFAMTSIHHYGGSNWWEEEPYPPIIRWSLESALERISQEIMSHVQERFLEEGEFFNDEELYFPFEYSFEYIPSFQIMENWKYYLPSEKYPEFYDEGGEFNPFELDQFLNAEEAAFGQVQKVVKEELELWRKKTIEYVKLNPLTRMRAQPAYRRWIFHYILKDEDYNNQGKMFVLFQP